MADRITASFDELIRNRYGVGADDESRFSLRLDDLLASYYGRESPTVPARGHRPTSVVLSCRVDDGEVLPQRRNPIRRREPAVQQSRMSQPSIARQASIPESAAAQECLLDVLDPLKTASAARPSAAPPSAPTLATPPLPALPLAPPASERAAAASATDTDFIEDMKDILAGRKVFDAASRSTVNARQKPEAPERPAQEARNEHAIFDRIAQSMQYANAYDLGSIDLENRFADFDATSERSAKPASASRKTMRSAPADAGPPAGTEDFLRDLDAIRHPSAAESESTAAPDGATRADRSDKPVERAASTEGAASPASTTVDEGPRES
jgi:hypothetical protein